MIVPFEQIYLEVDASLKSKALQVSSNWIRPKVNGIVIEDSFNNLVFPMSTPILDNNKQNLQLIQRQYDMIYSTEPNSILPWHYVIEYLNNDYVIYNTRPINIMYPYSLQEVKTFKKPVINDNTQSILNSADNTQTKIYVLIIGDSTRDVYTKQLYKKIVDHVIIPISKINFFLPFLSTNILPLNLGNRFITNTLQGMLIK
jgi:hypothetical protein